MTGNLLHVHVDMDELWAIAQCYGLAAFAQDLRPVYESGAANLARLFAEFDIRATWFVVGRDLEDPSGPAREFLSGQIGKGDAVANHSQSHRLDFRALSEEQIDQEIGEAESLIESTLGVRPIGFRAPGYGFSEGLVSVLRQRGYLYDSSLCPSPFGFVFRWMDQRICAQVRRNGWSEAPETNVQKKTQYSRFADVLRPIRPWRLDGPKAGHSADLPSQAIIEYPTAVAPGLRLPFQSGIVQRLGPAYGWTQTQLWNWLAPNVPMTLLFHGADLTDFSAVSHPFFEGSPFFSMSIAVRMERLRRLLEGVRKARECVLTESVLRQPETFG